MSDAGKHDQYETESEVDSVCGMVCSALAAR